MYFFPKKELEDLVTAPPRGKEGAMFKIEDSGEDRRMVSPGRGGPIPA